MTLSRFIQVLILTLQFAGASHGAEVNEQPLSLEDCIQLALERNLDLRIARYNPEIARSNLRLARARYEPVFFGSGIRNFSSSPGGIDAENRPFPGTESTYSDAAFFVEPDYVGVQPFGGDARVKWAQWDGNAWQFTGTGVVTAVSTTPGDAYLELGAGIATGTYHACKDTIVMSVDFTEQDASWVLELYAGIGDDAGEYTPGTKTARWEDLP